MKNKQLSYYFILIIFLISGVLSWDLYFRVYSQKDTVDLSHFPKTIGTWSSEDLPISKADLAILETQNAFLRRYTSAEGEEVNLFLVYSQNNRKVSHPPEICYTGSGATILSNVHDSIITIDGDREVKANRLAVEHGQTKQIIFYWFKVGDTFTSNYWKQQWLIATKSFLGQPASSAMIRLSTIVIAENEKKAVQGIKKFAQLIIPYLYQNLL